MCSVIEIKNSNEYYIHYHSPESLEPGLEESSSSSNKKVVNIGDDSVQDEQKEKAAAAASSSSTSDSVHSDEGTSGHHSERDCSVIEITQTTDTKMMKKDPGKVEEITSDRGSSLEGDESNPDSSSGSHNNNQQIKKNDVCLLYTSPSPRD